MADLQHVGDVERAVLGTAGLLHHLGVDVARGRHQHHEPTLVPKQEGGITDLAARQQEVILRAEGIHSKVVDLKET